MRKLESLNTDKLFCGETPVYTKETNSLTWIDTGNPLVNTLFLSTGKIEKKELPFTLEGLVPRKDGGWIAPTTDSLILLNDDFSAEKEFKNILPETPTLAFHDCTAGPDGFLYICTYDSVDYMRANGKIFKFGSDFKLETVIDGLALPNGSGFSPDGTIYYLNEMMASRILAFDFDMSSGTFSNRRIFCDIPPESGYPDGMTIDSEGCLWIALWQGFGLFRIDPNGNTIEKIETPVPTPTCMAFAGDDLKTLHITSATKGLSEEQLKDYPESGILYKTETEITGLPERIFL